MAFAVRWEREERQAVTLWVAGLSAGAEGIPTPQDVWKTFTEELAAPPVRRSRDEMALRRVLGLVA